MSRLNLRCGWTDLGKSLQIFLYTPFVLWKREEGSGKTTSVLCFSCRENQASPKQWCSVMSEAWVRAARHVAGAEMCTPGVCLMVHACLCVHMHIMTHHSVTECLKSEGTHKITGFRSLPLSGLSKTKPYDWGNHPHICIFQSLN